MKKQKAISYLIAWAMSTLLSFSGAACIVTGFEIGPANLWIIALVLAVYAAVSGAVIFYARSGWIFLGYGVVSLLALYDAWHNGGLEVSLEKLVYSLSSRYHMGYGWPVIRWSNVNLTDVPLDGSLILLGCMVVLVVLTTLRYRDGAIPAIIASLMPLCLCLVVTDSVPDKWCLALLIAALALLVLTNTVRRRSGADGNRLTARLLIPCLLLTAVLFALTPAHPPAFGTEADFQAILGYFQGLPFVELGVDGMFHVSISGIDDQSYNLQLAGPKQGNSAVVMDVISSKGGVLYLRGQAFDGYDGLQWYVSDPKRMETAGHGWPSDYLKEAGSVKITTQSGHVLRYTPYFLGKDDLTEMIGGRYPNAGTERSYSFRIYEPTQGQKENFRLEESERIQTKQLPEKTASQLAVLTNRVTQDYIQKHGLWQDWVSSFYKPQERRDEITAKAVAEYVRQSARYDLETRPMPEGETDFVLWFLNSSETGYCIHFASAAAAMLRSVGVPARVVTGYALRVERNVSAQVDNSMAHAWVEYFTAESGWTILDPTPGGVGDPGTEHSTQPTQTTRPEATEPSEVPETTAPTQPTESSRPEKDTEPTLPDRPRPTRPQQDQTRPTAPTVPTQPETEHEPHVNPYWRLSMQIIACVVLAVVLIFTQAWLRRYLRMMHLEKGDSNARAVAMWREIAYRCRWLHIKPEAGLYEIAEKAKFSQHRISDEELDVLKAYLRKTGNWVRYSAWYDRFVLFFIFAIA